MNTYTIGQQVEHATYGHGMIMNIEGDKLIINFTPAGIKQILAAFFKQGTYVAPVEQTEEVEEVRVPVVLTAGELAQCIWGGGKFWQSDMSEFAARVAAAAEGNATMTDIIAKWRKYRSASPAQAGAIARFAKQNNITL